jgi:hypothetical protein
MNMETECYEIGERVHVSRGSLSGPTTTDEFEIMAHYSVEDREPMYRLLSLRDRAERMVPQNELRRHMGPLDRQRGEKP